VDFTYNRFLVFHARIIRNDTVAYYNQYSSHTGIIEMSKKFELTHTYGVTRREYYNLTGITPEEMVRFLEAEVTVMSEQVVKLRKIYRRRSVTFASAEGRYLGALLKHIAVKIAQKRAKIQDIQLNDINVRVKYRLHE